MRHAAPGNQPVDIAKTVAKLAGLDPGIAAAVAALRSRGVETLGDTGSSMPGRRSVARHPPPVSEEHGLLRSKQPFPVRNIGPEF